MDHLRLRLSLSLLAFAAINVSTRADDWEVHGHIYRNVQVIKHDAIYATILCSDGGAKVAITDLSPEWQKKLGYDPAAAQKQNDDAAKQAEIIKNNKLLYDNAFHAVGKIIQVLPEGILAKFTASGNHVHENTIAETSTSAVQTGTPDLGQGADVVSTSVTYHTQYDHDQAQSDCAFVVCDTKGLLEDQNWKGTIFLIGSYSYTTVAGVDKVVPKYTISSEEFLSHLKTSRETSAATATTGSPPVAGN